MTTETTTEMQTAAANRAATAEKKSNTNKRTIELKPYSVTDLAKIYNVCNRTFKKWVSDIPEVGPKNGRYYSIPQVKIIFENLRIPTAITVEVEVTKTEVDMS